MSKLELITQQVLSTFPSAAEKVKVAAEESLEVAKKERVRVRRQRIVSTSSMQAVTETLTENPELSIPDDWRDDEDTVKITLPEK